MDKTIKSQFLKSYRDSISPPYFGGMKKWCEENIELPFAYSIPGKLNLDISPYLIKPMEDVDNPNITQINLIMAIQIGKSLLSEIAIPYFVINKPGPIYRIFSTNDLSDTFSESRLLPLLKNIPAMKPLLNASRFSITKSSVKLPHMAIQMGGANDSLAHGMSVKYLLADEVHLWPIGMWDKFRGRTSAFAGRRKIIVSSQPNDKGSELEKIYLAGKVYEWQFCCPKCKQYQPFNWSKRRNDDSFSGFNWDTILNPDGETTNISLSSRTTWLECDNVECRHRIKDTPSERLDLNRNGKYICIKDDGANDIVTYTCPSFVNVNLSFESAAAQYMMAKKMQRETGLDEQMKIFVNQTLGKFYKAEPMLDMKSLLWEPYDINDTDNTDWIRTMGVDVQRSGGVKYWVVWAWHKNGNESRRIDFGIARTWDEIEQIRIKYKVLIPALGVDSGDGENTQNIYQECIRRGKVIKQNGVLKYTCWQPMKGDQKLSYKHKNGTTYLYSEVSPQDSGFPIGSKYKGIPAPLVLWATTSVKIILTNLRDGKLSGIKWLIDRPDEDFDSQLRSESLREVVDKRTGATVNRWIQIGRDNHYLDACAMALTIALQAGVIGTTFTSDDELKKITGNVDVEQK